MKKSSKFTMTPAQAAEAVQTQMANGTWGQMPAEFYVRLLGWLIGSAEAEKFNGESKETVLKELESQAQKFTKGEKPVTKKITKEKAEEPKAPATPAPAPKASRKSTTAKAEAPATPAPAPKANKAPATPKAPKEKKASEPAPWQPYDRKPNPAKLHAVRSGSKVSKLIDLMARKQGATLDEMSDALSESGSKWPAKLVKNWLAWDVNTCNGYGVRSEKDKAGVERFHLVYPDGVTKPVPHTVAAVKAPKAPKVEDPAVDPVKPKASAKKSPAPAPEPEKAPAKKSAKKAAAAK